MKLKDGQRRPGTDQAALTSKRPMHRASPHHAHDHGLPAPQELHLAIEGMTCAGCAAAVQRALESRPDVHSASVSVTEGRAVITGDHLDAAALIEAVQKKGYGAQPIDEAPAPSELKSQIELRQQLHERQWRFRAIIGLSVWAPLEALHWLSHGAGAHGAAPGLIEWVLLLGATAVFATVGAGFYRSAWGALKRRTTNMDTLIALGATTAYLYSLVVFIAQLAGRMSDQPLYFAESAALLGIISLGHWLEARATARAGSAVRELLELQPDQAEIIQEQPAQQSDQAGPPRAGVPASHHARASHVPSAHVQPGDLLLIRPGGRVPVDGVVIDGESEVDESVVSGESVPRPKRAGDQVVAGSMNATGRLVVRATVDGRHTTIARIAEMVQRAQASKAEIQQLADRAAAVFVPVVLAVAAVTFICWWLAGEPITGIISTVTVLIISCPCALGLATPMAVMVGAGQASKRGILIKSAQALETAGRTAIVVFDKTGTLTLGRPTVTGVIPERPTSEDDLLRWAAAVEAGSEHPIGKAIVQAAADRGLAVPAVTDFAAIPGQGVRGVLESHQVVVTRDDAATCRVEIDGRLAGRIAVADALRPDAKQAIEQLRRMGVRVLLLSGDRRGIAEEIGAQLGIDPADVIAEATPDSKAAVLADLIQAARSSRSGRGRGAVAMIGDGINDAAALARADLGIAVASGTNIAIESADIVIPGGYVSFVPQTMHIGRQTLRTIKQNLFFAFFYNAVTIPAAALGLLGMYGPLMAAAAMGLSDITVIGNAIRLKGRLERQRRESSDSRRRSRVRQVEAAGG